MRPGAGGVTLTEELVAVALDGYEEARDAPAAARALFDHLACLTAGRRAVPEAVGDAGAAAALDRDDLHWPSLTHPGAIVWTVLRATRVGGAPRWRAAHAGYEVTARLGRALGAKHREHWHATTTAGTVGGAVAAALALDRDPVSAAGHAICVTGGSIVSVLERSATRTVYRDHAAGTALRCARLAQLPATRAGLEHPRGLFAAMGGGAETLLEPSTSSAIAETTFRRHATNGFAQAVVEAARDLAPDDAPGTVAVEVPPAAIALASNAAPRDAEAAWWSVQHAVAVTLLGLDLEDATLVSDPRVAALRERVELTAAPVSAVSLDGRRAERAQAARLTDDDLLAKWTIMNPGEAPPLELLA
jgi:2-methylcitrate dehydratase PrpD